MQEYAAGMVATLRRYSGTHLQLSIFFKFLTEVRVPSSLSVDAARCVALTSACHPATRNGTTSSWPTSSRR